MLASPALPGDEGRSARMSLAGDPDGDVPTDLPRGHQHPHVIPPTCWARRGRRGRETRSRRSRGGGTGRGRGAAASTYRRRWPRTTRPPPAAAPRRRQAGGGRRRPRASPPSSPAATSPSSSTTPSPQPSSSRGGAVSRGSVAQVPPMVCCANAQTTRGSTPTSETRREALVRHHRGRPTPTVRRVLLGVATRGRGASTGGGVTRVPGWSIGLRANASAAEERVLPADCKELTARANRP